MAVILYKPGNSKKVRGIPCDILICNEFSYLHNLEQGYFYSPEECYAETKEGDEEEAEKEAAEKAEAEPVLVGPAPDDEIRAAAKAAGITGWWNKNIEKLKSELAELEDAK